MRPVPVDGLRFPTRRAAVTAARLAARYRARLRGYDPAVADHDLVVRCDPAPSSDARGRTERLLTD
ncbi:hypothetical protein [Halosegnis sp.]|uniref:DUF7552 domain-containing protein n=1 Tax=Halosegnis sp. TaxID=2864959 RepID=UPI0035D3F997